MEADPDATTGSPLYTAPWGQFAIGTFIADGTDPDLTIEGPTGGPHLTALQVRVIPEPSSIVLLGIAGLAVVFLFRRRT